jgi:hypothetical protein
MRIPYCLLVAAFLGIAGCPTRSKYDQMPTVRITSPIPDPTYTNGTVRITAAIDPVLDLPVVLLENSTKLIVLTSPSYSYDWVTSAVSEGEHTIVAEVALSGGTVRSAPITIVVDRTPPTVSRIPAPGAKDVALHAPIQAMFSEPIVLSQPVDATFSLSVIGESTLATHATVDAQGRTATIAIDDLTALLLPTALLGTIGSTITDRAGNPLTVPSSDWVWDVPDFVKLPPSPLCPRLSKLIHLPVFAVGSDLKPVLGWAASVIESAQIHCQVQLSIYDGQGWNPIGPPSNDINSAMLGGATLALDGDDQPFVAWRPSTVPDPGEIAVASWNGTAWETVPSILPQAGVFFPLVYPVLRIGEDKRPILLWGAGPAADRYFMARQTPTGWNGDFGQIPIISQQAFDGPHFDMILDASGSPIVSWIAPANRGHVSLWDGSAWSAAFDIPDMTEPFLASDSTHAPMIVSGGSGTFFVQHLVGNVLQPMPSVAAPPQTRHPHVAAGPDGLPILAWFDAQTQSVGMGRWLGQRWDTRAYAFSPANALDEPPQLVVDRQGTAWIGWRDSTGEFNLWMSNY